MGGIPCAITEEELLANFKPELKALAQQQELSDAECLAKVRSMYNGYHFHQKGSSVFNPFSTLNLLRAKEFKDFWFQTGTPTFFVDLLKITPPLCHYLTSVSLHHLCHHPEGVILPRSKGTFFIHPHVKDSPLRREWHVGSRGMTDIWHGSRSETYDALF